MKYTLTKANLDGETGTANDNFPDMSGRQAPDQGDPQSDQIHKNVFMGKLEDMIHDSVNWGRKNSIWPYNFGLSCC